MGISRNCIAEEPSPTCMMSHESGLPWILFAACRHHWRILSASKAIYVGNIAGGPCKSSKFPVSFCSVPARVVRFSVPSRKCIHSNSRALSVHCCPRESLRYSGWSRGTPQCFCPTHHYVRQCIAVVSHGTFQCGCPTATNQCRCICEVNKVNCHQIIIPFKWLIIWWQLKNNTSKDIWHSGKLF